MVMVTLNNRGWQKNAEDLQKRQAQTAHTRTGGSYSSKFHESARKAELLSVLFNESKGLKYRQLTILMYEVLFSSNQAKDKFIVTRIYRMPIYRTFLYIEEYIVSNLPYRVSRFSREPTKPLFQTLGKDTNQSQDLVRMQFSRP